MKYTFTCKLVSLDSNGFHLLVPVFVPNCNNDGFFIIDSGASKSVIDDSILENIKHTVIEQDSIESSHLTDMIEGKIVSLDLLCIQNVEFKDFEALSMPLQHVNSIYSRFIDKPIWGLIGGDFLKRYKAVISYKSNTISVIV